MEQKIGMNMTEELLSLAPMRLIMLSSSPGMPGKSWIESFIEDDSYGRFIRLYGDYGELDPDIIYYKWNYARQIANPRIIKHELGKWQIVVLEWPKVGK